MELIDYAVYRTYKKFDSCERARGPLEGTIMIFLFFLLIPFVNLSKSIEDEVVLYEQNQLEVSEHTKYKIVIIDGIQYIQYTDSVAPNKYNTSFVPLKSKNHNIQKKEGKFIDDDLLVTILFFVVFISCLLLGWIIAKKWYPDKKIISLCDTYDGDDRNSTPIIFFGILNAIVVFVICGIEIALLW